MYYWSDQGRSNAQVYLTTTLEYDRMPEPYTGANPQEPLNSTLRPPRRWLGDASLVGVGLVEGQIHPLASGRLANSQDGSTAPWFRMGVSESPAFLVAEWSRWRRAKRIRPGPMQVLGHYYSRVIPSRIKEILREVDGYPRVGRVAADKEEEEMEQVD